MTDVDFEEIKMKDLYHMDMKFLRLIGMNCWLILVPASFVFKGVAGCRGAATDTDRIASTTSVYSPHYIIYLFNIIQQYSIVSGMSW